MGSQEKPAVQKILNRESEARFYAVARKYEDAFKV